MKIRKATVGDIPEILCLIKELAEYEKLLDEVTATEEILKESLFSETATAYAILVEIENNIVGFAIYFYNFSTFLGKAGIYIEDIYVRPEYRGHGIGKKLLSYLASEAKKKNCERIEWWVLDWNKNAINFYEQIGAKAMDEWTVFRLTTKEIEKLSSE